MKPLHPFVTVVAFWFSVSHRRLSLTAVMALLAWLSSPCFAVWQSTPDALTSFVDDTHSAVRDCRSLPDGAGGLFVGWVDSSDVAHTDTEGNVRIQRMDADGNRLWGDTGVLVTPAGELNHLVGIATDGAGGLFVAWKRESTVFPVTFALYLMRLDPNGSKLWPTSILVDPRVTSVPSKGMNLASDGAGGVYLGAVNALSLQLTGYHVAGDGALNPGWVSAVTVGTHFYVGVDDVISGFPLGNTPSSFWIVGTLPYFSDSWTCTAVQVSANGTTGKRVPLGNQAVFRSAVADTAGGFWAMLKEGSSVYVQHVDSAETPQLVSPVLRTSTAQLEVTPLGIVADANYGSIAVWEEWNIPSDAISLKAQKLTAIGDPLWPAGGLTIATGIKGMTGDRPLYRAISDGAGGLIVTAERKTGGIAAYRVNANGEPLWDPEGVTVSTVTPGFQYHLVGDGASGGLCTFFNPEVFSPIFAGQHVNLSGSLGSNSPAAKLANLSARARVGTGSSVLITGLVVRGGPVKVLVRGVGPTLGLEPFNVPGVLADPLTELHSEGLLGANDDWSSSPDAAEVAAFSTQMGAFALPNPSKDSALVTTLQPGNYTALTRGSDGGTGVAIEEAYVQPVGGGRLINMSVRAAVGTGADILIPGIVVAGSGARTLLLRAVGPTLGAAPFNVEGVLADPALQIFRGSTVIGGNDNWSNGNATQIANIAAKVGAFPLPSGSLDAALVVTLGVGNYTVQVRGAGGGTGVCLVEVYEVP